MQRQKELDELFTQVLAALSREGLITLEQVMQDGTKIRAVASGRSFQWDSTLRGHLERARQRVTEMGDPRGEEYSERVKQARARAQREQQQRLETALKELAGLQKEKHVNRPVSVSEPEARRMKLGDGGIAPAYNVQVSSDGAHGLIVEVALTQEPNDTAQLVPAVERIERRLQRTPRQMVADKGYSTRAAIEEMAERKTDFLGSMLRKDATSGRTAPDRFPPSAFLYQPETNRYICPGGKWVRPQGRFNHKRRGITVYRYEAAADDCKNCALRPQCCPNNQSRGRGLMRVEESAAVVAFRKKMATPEAQNGYRRRGRVVEFCHAWIKSKLGLARFHVRGLPKAQTEILWACLTYNLQHWIRLRKALSPVAG